MSTGSLKLRGPNSRLSLLRSMSTGSPKLRGPNSRLSLLRSMSTGSLKLRCQDSWQHCISTADIFNCYELTPVCAQWDPTRARAMDLSRFCSSCPINLGQLYAERSAHDCVLAQREKGSCHIKPLLANKNV